MPAMKRVSNRLAKGTGIGSNIKLLELPPVFVPTLKQSNPRPNHLSGQKMEEASYRNSRTSSSHLGCPKADSAIPKMITE
jgi:hypothetical protein